MPTESKVEIPQGLLAQVVVSVFETMLGLEAAECGEPWILSRDRLTAAVHLVGEWNGTVLIECDRRQACQFAGRYLSIKPPEEVDDTVRDVLLEISNVIGGNIRSALTGGVKLSMLSVVDGSDCCLRFYGSEICERVALRSAEGVIWVTILATLM